MGKNDERFEVIIKPDGSIEIQGFGFKGKKCKLETKWLEKLLGTVKKEVLKKDYYECDREPISESVENGR